MAKTTPRTFTTDGHIPRSWFREHTLAESDDTALAALATIRQRHRN